MSRLSFIGAYTVRSSALVTYSSDAPIPILVSARLYTLGIGIGPILAVSD